jgi:hypothetical protein
MAGLARVGMRWLACLTCVIVVATSDLGEGARTLPEYRYFRALSIDLVGRPATRDELAAFERTDFDLDAWLASHLVGQSYAERMRRVYMDLLRLEVGPAFQFVPPSLVLRRHEVLGPDGPTFVYYRRGQRRAAAAIDGDFCFTSDETGLRIAPNAAPVGTPTTIARATFEARTVAVKPWWLYADYRGATPTDRYAPEWARRFPGFQLVPGLLVEPDGKTPTTEVRVCREETQIAESGTVYASGRPAPKRGDPTPAGRLTQPPVDSGFARAQRGRAVSCLSGTGFANSLDCGCGIGLDRCWPGAGFQNEPPAFVMALHAPLGEAAPFDAAPQPGSAWERQWWSEEAKHFLERIFVEDRDMREILTGRATMVNGPLAQFYRGMAGATCCGGGAEVGYTDPRELVERGAVPWSLVPTDTRTWMTISDRGPLAAGIMTMPIFLAKYGSRRARAHVVYSAFLCREFVAEAVTLAPSTEPDLTKRPGCATCHQKLEPMAAYFTRILESDWTYLPADPFPLSRPACAKTPNASLCRTLYDPAFAQLRGAYASPPHAEAGPAGLAAEIVRSPEFAPCVVENIAGSLLGRPLAAEDAAWKAQLAATFVDGGYRARALVKAIVTSPRYRDANDVRRTTP